MDRTVGSLERSISPPRHAYASPLGSEIPPSGGALTAAGDAVSSAFKRARDSRAVTFVTGTVGTVAGSLGGAVSRVLTQRDTGAGQRARREQRESREYLRQSTQAALVPRPAPGGGAAAVGGGGSPAHAGGHGRAVPMSTTVVQDGVRWLNLARLLNFARVFSCVRPLPGQARQTRQSRRRRVRFGAGASGRALMLKAASSGEVGKSNLAEPGTRPVYVQVRQGRQLVWPTFEGAEHTCYCLMLVADQPRATTKALTVASAPGGTAGGAPGGAGGGGPNCVTWNEVFSFPRSCLEGAAAGRVLLQVWSAESFGDDVLVGQAELLLAPLLEAERPHPINAALELQAIDDATGQPEPGSCGELLVSAWAEAAAEPSMGAPKTCMLSSRAADLDEAGVVTSNLSAPCGNKSMPQVVHSPLGTLYEEPCVVVLKMTVVGLVDLNYDMLVSSAQQGGMGKRRVRLELARSAATTAPASRGFTTVTPGPGGLPNAAAGAAAIRAPPEKQETLTSPTGAGLPTTSSNGTGPTSGGGGGGGANAAPTRMNTPLRRGLRAYIAATRGRLVPTKELDKMNNVPHTGHRGAAANAAAAAAGGVLNWMEAARRRRHSNGSGAASGGGWRRHDSGGATADELLEEEDDGAAGPGGGGGGGEDFSGGGGGGRSAAAVLGDDDGDGSSMALRSTALISAMTGLDSTVPPGSAAGQASGQGMFCYFKVSVDKQSDKSRLRWLAAPPPPPPPAAALAAFMSDSPLPPPPMAALQPSTFVFAMARPLPNAPVGLALYVTGSAKRRGRVVGRVVAPLYDLLDHVLGAAAAAARPGGAGGGGDASCRPDMGVSGKPVEVTLPFEDPELGSIKLIVQLADADERAMLYRAPLVSDPSQLVSDGGGGGGCPFGGPQVVAAEGGGMGPAPPVGTLSPVLGDAALLRRVLESSGVDESVEDWFVRGFAKAGSAKAGGSGTLQGDLAIAMAETYYGRFRSSGKGLTADRLAANGLTANGGMGRAGSINDSASATGSSSGAHGDLFAYPLPPGAATAALGRPSGPPGRGALPPTDVQGSFDQGHRPGPAHASPRAPHTGANPLTNFTSGPASSNPNTAASNSSPGRRSGAPTTTGGAPSTGTGAAGGTATGGGGGVGISHLAPPEMGGRRSRFPTTGPQVVGSLLLRITSLNSSGALSGTSSCCCIVKCGPHWLRTGDRTPSEGAGSLPQWQVVFPLYSPATVLTVGIFASSTKTVMGLTFNDTLTLVSRVRLKLSNVRPYKRNWHVVAMHMNATSGGGAPPLVGVLGVKLQFHCPFTLAASYLAAAAPESLYELELDGDAALRVEADNRRIAENWLAAAQPPIPPEVTRLLLDDGRSTFDFARTKTNWRRVKAGMRLFSQLNAWFKRICSWSSARDSWEVVFCIALVCYRPSMGFKLLMSMTAMYGIRRYLDLPRKPDTGTDYASAGAISAVFSPAAAATAAAAVAAAAAGGAREPVGTIGDVTVGGGVLDAGSDEEEAGEDSKVPVGTVAEFKRKFGELVELALMLQNLFDDVASILERLQAVLSFQDVTATWLFIAGCVLLVGLVAALGFPTFLFLGLLWQVRPPALRDALPAPPVSYFLKLPCKSTAEFG
ncbi:hypothetical protein HYH03_011767 [Edaphochlamys debaryana]|uniref:C2 domain-containing protein n=1 Tax=Edaphochlamys debaryana TaxID=47281 RepID=A0A835XVH7_9CHLO|nr:hypothetical protein HYH03_011767 [Edaphochlamys debaryana]|eukprot:KAG2489818.1 hypothetical protein HYH03_011767 [Edaphochlamys debaryana]